MGAGSRRTRASNASSITYGLRSLSRAAGNSEPMLDHSATILNPSRSSSRDIVEELVDNAFQTLEGVTTPPVEPKAPSPLSEVSLDLPSFSSLSPKAFPLRTEDDDKDTDGNDHLTPSDSASNLDIAADTDNDDHITLPDSVSNLDLAAPSLAELHTAEAICQLKTQQNPVESPINGNSYGPKRNTFAAERNDGHLTLQQQTSQTYSNSRAPVLLQSTNFPNPFAGNSSQAFPLGASAFGSYQQHPSYFPRPGLQTQPIVQSYEAQDQYGVIQHGQPQHGQPQYGQAQHVEHSRSTIFPPVLGPFQRQLETILEDAAAEAQSGNTPSAGTVQQHSTQANGSRKNRKRKDSDGADETNTNTKRRRSTGPYVPSSANDPPSDDPQAPKSDAELERQAVHIFNRDPWYWSAREVYFSLTNVRSFDLRHNDNLTLPHPHLGLILSKLVMDGPTLLVNLTQANLQGLGITRADHRTATGFVLENMRHRSPIYQFYRNAYHIPTLSAKTLGPQSVESHDAVLSQLHQHITSRPLRNGENRKYHFVFGCYVASSTGPDGQYTLLSKTVAQCLDERRDSLLSQSSDQQRRESVSFHNV